MRRRIIFSLTINDSSSFQSINGGLSQVSYSSQVKRGRPDSDESDDEESIIATQESQTANLKSQDINNKKKKKHQWFMVWNQ